MRHISFPFPEDVPHQGTFLRRNARTLAAACTLGRSSRDARRALVAREPLRHRLEPQSSEPPRATAGDSRVRQGNFAVHPRFRSLPLINLSMPFTVAEKVAVVVAICSLAMAALVWFGT
jgi:hypothetical protein